MEQIPALVRILIVFGLALAVIRFRCPVGGALLGGAVMLGVVFGAEAREIASSLLKSFRSEETLVLLALIWLITGISRAMDFAGQMERIVTSVRAALRGRRITLMALPALIGLLPMPGGAMFSAPMVDKVLEDTDSPGPLKTVINYWFRHIWEYWWPMYPGVLLCAGITGIDTFRFIVHQLPLTVVAVASGYFFIVHPGMKEMDWEKQASQSGANPGTLKNQSRSVVHETFPILLIVGLLILLSLPGALGWLPEKPSILDRLPVLLSLLIGLIWVVVSNRLGRKHLIQSLFSKSLVSLVLLVFGIMGFRGMLTESGAVEGLTTEMQAWNIPLIGVAMFVPFLSGLVTGIGLGFVGAAFSLLVPLIHGAGQSEHLVAYTVLGFAFGYMGMILSPVHVCLVLTREYWNAPMGKVYQRLMGPVITCLMTALFLFVLYHIKGG